MLKNLKSLSAGFMSLLIRELRRVLHESGLTKEEKQKEKLSSSTLQPSQPLPQDSRPQSSYSKPLSSDLEFPRQTDNYFNNVIRKYGCYVLSIAKIAYDEKAFCEDNVRCRIATNIEIGKALGYLTANLRVLDPVKMFVLFGLLVKYNDRHDPPHEMCRPEQREILYFENGNMGHFVVGNGMGDVAWDPWLNSNTVQYGKLVSKRIFTVIGKV